MLQPGERLYVCAQLLHYQLHDLECIHGPVSYQ